MTASTSIVERALAEPDGRPVSPGELDLALAVERQAAGPAARGTTSPGSDAAGLDHPDLGDQAGGERDADGWGAARRGQAHVQPAAPPAARGATAPATAERPTALGLAKVTSSSVIARPPQRARRRSSARR